MQKTLTYLVLIGFVLSIGNAFANKERGTIMVPDTTIQDEPEPEPTFPSNMPIPPPLVRKLPGVPFYEVIIPGRPTMVVPKAKLSDVINDYVSAAASGKLEEYYQQMNTATFGTGSNSGIDSNPLSSLGNHITDKIEQEINEIIGETWDTIKDGLKDMISQAVDGVVSAALQTTPVSEVSRMRKVVADGLSKEQKIEYQQYKTEYARMKAFTEISDGFKKFYKEINLPGLQNKINAAQTGLETILQKDVFTPQERALIRQAADRVSDLRSISADLKIALNQTGQDAVWMSEADRLKIVDRAYRNLLSRNERMYRLVGQIADVYANRSRLIAENRRLKALYNENNSLLPSAQLLKGQSSQRPWSTN